MDYLAVLFVILFFTNTNLAIGAVGCSLLSEILKHLVNCTIGENKITRRPEGHGKCGNSTINKIGMPSGHSLVAGYLFGKTKSNLKWGILAIPLSRVHNKCHTELQVVVGFVLGLVISSYKE